jgi:hypothetical protein
LGEPDPLEIVAICRVGTKGEGLSGTLQVVRNGHSFLTHTSVLRKSLSEKPKMFPRSQNRTVAESVLFHF